MARPQSVDQINGLMKKVLLWIGIELSVPIKVELATMYKLLTVSHGRTGCPFENLKERP